MQVVKAIMAAAFIGLALAVGALAVYLAVTVE